MPGAGIYGGKHDNYCPFFHGTLSLKFPSREEMQDWVCIFVWIKEDLLLLQDFLSPSVKHIKEYIHFLGYLIAICQKI